jgi:hypothetical protein
VEILEPTPLEIITGKCTRQLSKKIQDTLEGGGEGNKELKLLMASLAQVTSHIKSDPLSVAEAQ